APRGGPGPPRADRGRDLAARGAAERHPRGRRQGLRARPLRRPADLAPARGGQRLPAGRAAPVAAAGRRLRERPGTRRRPLPGAADRGGRGDRAVIDTLRLTAEGARGLLERKEVSGTELRAAYREAIDARNDELHCFLTLVDDDDNDGVPIALKDVISTKGIETTAGSKILEGYVPVFDSTVAARCKAAGLQLLGKTNTDEFAMGSSTENSAFGPSRNPWDPTRVPGGSGGGSAAAVSAGLTPWALGSDTGGSIKQPSSLCGNVGLRPTYGTVSRYGIVAFASSLDQVGPVTKTVRDNALLYGIISGRDECDSTTVDVPPVELPHAEDLKGLRVGVPKELNEAEGIEPGVSEAVRLAIELCSKLGAEVGECELPRSVEYGLPCYYLVAPAEASSNLARYDGVRYVLRREADGYYEMVSRTRDAGFGDEPKRRIMLGTYALSAGYYEA